MSLKQDTLIQIHILMNRFAKMSVEEVRYFDKPLRSKLNTDQLIDLRRWLWNTRPNRHQVEEHLLELVGAEPYLPVPPCQECGQPMPVPYDTGDGISRCEPCAVKKYKESPLANMILNPEPIVKGGSIS